jgi:hypothetical protein
VLSAAGLVLFWGFAELAARGIFALYGVEYSSSSALGHAALLAKRRLQPPVNGIVFEKPLAVADPVTGYRCIPGVHRLAMLHEGKRRDFRVTIGADGYRVTRAGAADPSQPEILLHGCSFTWGFLLNDEETFAWKLQELLPDCSVRNLAQNGFGTAHAFLQAVSLERAPAVAIVVYAAFHKERNSPSRNWMKQMVSSGDAFNARRIAYPWVTLQGDTPRVELRTMRFGPQDNVEGHPPDAAVEEKNTLALMRAIRARYEAAGTRFAVASFTGVKGDAAIETLARDGVSVLDLSLGSPDYLPIEYKMPPWDDFHPGPRAALIYAERLASFVGRIRN